MVFKPRASPKAHNANLGESRPASYRAVEIRSQEDACEAAKAERGKRHLSKDAPTLPLSECDKRDRCTCRYRHLVDRRGKVDRRGGGPPSIGKRTEAERRATRDRRADDRLEDPTVIEAQISLEDTYYGFRRR